MWKNHGSAYSEAGLPDIMALKDGVFVGIELKREGGKETPDPKQFYWMGKIKRAGGLAGWTRTVSGAIKIAEGKHRDYRKLSE